MTESMTEITKALRCCADSKCGECNRLNNGIREYCVCSNDLHKVAADTIDRLTAENAELYGRLAPYEETGLTAQEYTESVGFVLALNKAIKKATGKTALDWEKLTAENAALTERLKAAVEDMKVGWLCRACIKRVKGKEWCNCHAVNFVDGPEKTITCDNFEWRGPVAGRGEAE